MVIVFVQRLTYCQRERVTEGTQITYLNDRYKLSLVLCLVKRQNEMQSFRALYIDSSRNWEVTASNILSTGL